MTTYLSKRTLAVQTLLPPDYDTSTAFARDLSAMREAGYSGIELNIANTEAVDPERLKAFLAGYGLRMTAYASGAAAKVAGLSLSHANDARRREAVAACERFLAFAARFNAGVITGFLKGGVDARSDRLIESLRDLAPVAEKLGVDLIVEATNRYESGTCNSVDETLAVLDAVGSNRLRILPDTFHMNIEESDMFAAIERCMGRCASIHLSDNNRFLPGKGAIDFGAVLRRLERCGFDGVIGLEGNMAVSFEQDVRAAAAYLSALD